MTKNGAAGDAGAGVELDLIWPVSLVKVTHVIVHYWVALESCRIKQTSLYKFDSNLKLCITGRLVFFVHLFTSFFL